MIQSYDADGAPQADARETQETGPVFADPSGQRRRLMRAFGAAASIVLAGALIMAGIGLFGGPDTPFSVFGSPDVRNHGHQGTTGHGASGGPADGNSTAGAPGSAPAHAGSPSASPDRSPTPAPSSSPAPTNRPGRTPPGRSRSKQAHPSPSSSHGA